jgi:hypothetical protein
MPISTLFRNKANSISSAITTVKPVYKGHSKEPENVALSAVALYVQVVL